MEEVILSTLNELKPLIATYSLKLSQRVPEVAHGFQEETFQDLMQVQAQTFMPVQLLNEAREY
jgi:hypothetical protein